MPNDLRPRLICRLAKYIEELTQYEHIRPTRCYLKYLCMLYDDLESNRYLNRPRKYRSHNLHLDNGLRFHDVDRTHRILLQMTVRELGRIVDIFGDDRALKSRGKRPMAPPGLQLRVFVHRMAFGSTCESIAALFHITGESKRVFT
jgi:hypothetical protein